MILIWLSKQAVIPIPFLCLESLETGLSELSATHVTFDESEVSKSITWLCIKSLNARLSMDSAHFLIDAQHCQQT